MTSRLPNQTISTQATAPSVSSGSRAQAASNRTGLIAGCTIAGLVVTALVVFLLWRWTHRKHRTSGDKVHMTENTHHLSVIPYGYESTTQDGSSNSPADSGLSPGSSPPSGVISKAARELARSGQRGGSTSSATSPTGGEPAGSEQGTIASMAMVEVQGLRAELEGLRSLLRNREAHLDAPPDYASHV